MINNNGSPTKSSFWANLFKAPTEASEIEEVMRSMLPFKYVGKNYLHLLVKLIHNRAYAANEYVFYQQDPGIGLYIIVKGEVLITQESDEEKFDLARLGRGDFFGELALLDEERRSASAIAQKDSQLAVLFKPDLDEFVETHPKEGIKILRGISQILATRLRNLNQDYLTLYNKSINK